LFDAKAGDFIYNKSGNSIRADLYMPEKIPRERKKNLMLSTKVYFEDISSINNILTNIFGFIPIGFLFCAILKTHRNPTITTLISLVFLVLLVSFRLE